jgi:hypothetical protein
VSTAAYQATAAAETAAGGPDGPADGGEDQSSGDGGSPDQGNEEVVEGEFKEA